MRINTTLAALLLAVSNPLGAATIMGYIVANHKGGPGIPHVSVKAIGNANPTSSLPDGSFSLDVPNGQPGDTVQLHVEKSGMEVVNSFELRVTLTKAANATALIVVLCREGDFQEMNRLYYGIGRDDPTAERNRKRLEDSQAKQQTIEAENGRLRIERDHAKEELAREKAEKQSDADAHEIPPIYRSYDAMELNRDAATYRRENQPEKARKAYDEALKKSRKLAEQDPTTYMPDVADTLNNLGDMLSGQNQLDEARKDYNEALDINCDLAQQNSTYLPNVAMTLYSLGTLFSKQKRPEEERNRFELALQLFRAQANLNPTYRPHVAETLLNIGILDLDQNRTAPARDVFREALDIYETLANNNPGQYGREIESAREHLERAFNETLKSYLEKEKEDRTTYLPLIAEILNNIGILNYDQNRPAEGRKALSDAIAIYRDLAKKNPQYGRDALRIYETLIRKNAGQFESEFELTGRLLEAAFDEALASYRDQAHQNRELYSPDVAATLRNLGILYRDQNRVEEARKAFVEARGIYEPLANNAISRWRRLNPWLSGTLDRSQFQRDLEEIKRLLEDLTDR
jgi:Tfp pilus assembly protein PilF